MSSDSKPTPTEPDSSAPLAKSLAERLTFPDSKSRPNPNASTFTPSKFSWADEAESPIADKKEEKAEEKAEEKNGDLPRAQTDGAADDSLAMAQKDGATTWMNGSQGLDEPEFDVNVKLADLQDDPNNPLYSAQTFEQLNL